jgi:hypothetical protein
MWDKLVGISWPGLTSTKQHLEQIVTYQNLLNTLPNRNTPSAPFTTMQVLKRQNKGAHLNTIERFYLYSEYSNDNHLNDEQTIFPNRLFDAILNPHYSHKTIKPPALPRPPSRSCNNKAHTNAHLKHPHRKPHMPHFSLRHSALTTRYSNSWFCLKLICRLSIRPMVNLHTWLCHGIVF